MAFTDTLITLIVIFGLFVLGYSWIMKKSITEIFEEVKGLFKGKE